MVFGEKSLTCVECNEPFTFSVDDQRYHLEKGYTDPKRCPACRRTRRANRNEYGGGGGFEGGTRQMYPVTCAQCGVETEVPFLPRGDRPVYCSDCFRQQRSQSDSPAHHY